MNPGIKHFIGPVIGLIALIASIEINRHASDTVRNIEVLVCVLFMPALLIGLRLYGFIRSLLLEK